MPKIFGLSTIKEYVMHNFLHKVFSGIFQVIISNGMGIIMRTQEGCGAVAAALLKRFGADDSEEEEAM